MNLWNSFAWNFLLSFSEEKKQTLLKETKKLPNNLSQPRFLFVNLWKWEHILTIYLVLMVTTELLITRCNSTWERRENLGCLLQIRHGNLELVHLLEFNEVSLLVWLMGKGGWFYRFERAHPSSPTITPNSKATTC